MIGGVKYRLSGWVRESTRGKFLSLSAKPDEPMGGARRAKQSAEAMLQ